MKGCRGRLRDMVLDWDDALPEDDLKASEQHASNAQLALCLGTSLQVRPANSLPLRTVKAGMSAASRVMSATEAFDAQWMVQAISCAGESFKKMTSHAKQQLHHECLENLMRASTQVKAKLSQLDHSQD